MVHRILYEQSKSRRGKMRRKWQVRKALCVQAVDGADLPVLLGLIVRQRKCECGRLIE